MVSSKEWQAWADKLAERIEPVKSAEFPEAVYATATAMQMIEEAVNDRIESRRAAQDRHPRIKDRCPSCGSQSLFIGDGGGLTCSVLECKNPCVGDEVKKIAADRERLESELAWIDDRLARRPALDGTRAERIEKAISVASTADKLQQFKDWVHQYLDRNGVPHHPPGVHGAEGCRIGDRMDWLMAKLVLAEQCSVANAIRLAEVAAVMKQIQGAGVTFTERRAGVVTRQEYTVTGAQLAALIVAAKPPEPSPEFEKIAAEFRARQRATDDGAPDGTLDGLRVCARMLDTYTPDLFPANEKGQVHFARAMMESVADEMRAFLKNAEEKA